LLQSQLNHTEIVGASPCMAIACSTSCNSKCSTILHLDNNAQHPRFIKPCVSLIYYSTNTRHFICSTNLIQTGNHCPNNQMPSRGVEESRYTAPLQSAGHRSQRFVSRPWLRSGSAWCGRKNVLCSSKFCVPPFRLFLEAPGEFGVSHSLSSCSCTHWSIESPGSVRQGETPGRCSCTRRKQLSCGPVTSGSTALLPLSSSYPLKIRLRQLTHIEL
jgi:hypothetical protein